MRFSRIEIQELVKAWFFISLAFMVLFSNGYRIFSLNSSYIILTFIISAFTVGLAFLLHELAHKAVAQNYGFEAEFRAFHSMLWLALLFSFFGFIIAAPGAVMIKAFRISREKNGKIALAGPLVNIILAIIFLLLLFLLTGFELGVLKKLFLFGFTINSLLALFNLIPFPPFDGSKVFIWNKVVWIILTVFALILYISSFAAF